MAKSAISFHFQEYHPLRQSEIFTVKIHNLDQRGFTPIRYLHAALLSDLLSTFSFAQPLAFFTVKTFG